MGFPRQEYWSGLPFPSPGGLPDPGIELMSFALQADSLPLNHPGSPVTQVHLANTRLVNNGVPRSEIDREPTKFLVYPYKQKSSKSSEPNSNLNQRNGVMTSQLIARWVNEQTQNSLSEKKARPPWGRIPVHYWNFILLIFLPASPKRPTAFYQGNCSLGKRK